MRPTDIHPMDRNLLRVCMAVMEEGSVTAAGDRLGLAQSSISHALTRLRRVSAQLFADSGTRSRAGSRP